MRIIIFIAVFIISGCSPIDLSTIQDEIDVFHTSYQKGDYDKIYGLSSDTMQKSVSENDFIKFMETAKNTDLGGFKKTSLKYRKNVYNLINKNEVVVVCFTEYIKRTVQETFIFKIVDGKLKLKGYKYDSIM